MTYIIQFNKSFKKVSFIVLSAFSKRQVCELKDEQIFANKFNLIWAY